MSEGPRVLTVDDEPNVRLVLRTTLEVDGYRVIEAEDGGAALDLLRATHVDLVLLDLRMPLMDGMETLRRLREVGDQTPVVMLTAHGSIPDAVAAMRLGAIDFLSKPLTPAVLRRVVAEVVDRHATARPGPAPETSESDTAETRFAETMRCAKRALNRREFDEAEVFLEQAVALRPLSTEAGHLREALRESRREHEGPYRMLREWFPVGRPRRKP